MEEVAKRLSPDVAALMLTNPNTCGLFERDVVAIAEAVHAAGAFFYADGANFNAIMGKVRPGDLGVDAMHINLHKTFSTPHGGGGPGAGPVALSAALAPFMPVPYVLVSDPQGLTPGRYVEHAHSPSPRATPTSAQAPSARGEGRGEGQPGARTSQGQGRDGGHAPTSVSVAAPHPNPLPARAGRGDPGGASGEVGTQSLGRMCAFHGQMGMFVRALAYMLSHGADGLRQASEDAVLNANYVRASLADLMSPAFGDRPCMHEALFDDRWLEGTDIATLDFAKAMIDEGFHPMTVYFPLVVHGAMLIEPTEFGIQAEPRSVHRLPARPGRRRQVRRHRPLQGRPALRPAPPPRRDQGRARAAAAVGPVSFLQGCCRVMVMRPPRSVNKLGDTPVTYVPSDAGNTAGHV